ncbi:MAG: hypothetical protein KAT38_04610 [Bacteroidales bacterium]|nr:hypothetical protein [Bacteroidales bacterium]
MNKAAITLILGLSFIIIYSCSTTEQTTATNRKLKFSLQGGANIGGITENTDMTVVSNVKIPPEVTVDAFTGATRTGFNAGMHINKTFKRNQIEAGIDYMYNHQTFTYTDAENMYIGVRKLNVSQVLFPLTYNFVFFENQFPHTDIQLKAGYMGQLNFISTSRTGVLPEYSLKIWSNGLTFGISAFPFQFDKGSKLGIYFDMYRGSQIYEDYYNQSTFKMPGSSFMKFGVKYQFK